MGFRRKPISLTTSIRIERWLSIAFYTLFTLGIFYWASGQSLPTATTRTTGRMDINRFIVKTTDGRAFQLLGIESNDTHFEASGQLGRGALYDWLVHHVQGQPLTLTIRTLKQDNFQSEPHQAVLAYCPDGTLINERLIEKGLVTVNHKTRHVLDQWFERLSHRAD